MMKSMESLFPNASYFVDEHGWIEFGRDDDSPLTSFIRALNMGGMIWEGESSYPNLDAAFADLERGLTDWMEAEGIEIE